MPYKLADDYAIIIIFKFCALHPDYKSTYRPPVEVTPHIDYSINVSIDISDPKYWIYMYSQKDKGTTKYKNQSSKVVDVFISQTSHVHIPDLLTECHLVVSLKIMSGGHSSAAIERSCLSGTSSHQLGFLHPGIYPAPIK